MSDLHRLIYTSRNFLTGGEAEQAAEVDRILAVSKRNNARVGVTGALLFNAGFFAQILEGPRAAVEATFERIQRDPRHSDVSVLGCEPVAARGFPNWSMAFVGHAARGRTLWGDFAQRTGFDLEHIEADRLFATLLTIVEREEEAGPAQPVDPLPAAPPPAAPPPLPAHAPAHGPAHAPAHAPAYAPAHGPTDSPAHAAPQAPRGSGLDVERLRGALRDRAPEARAAPAQAAPAVPPPLGPATEVEAAVLRAALDEERGRTTALRRELDDARIALAAAQAEAGAIARLGEIWAERARAMAGILSREPGVVRAGPVDEPQPAIARPTLVRSEG